MSTNIPIDPIQESLSIQDVQDVFSYLGIDISKFRYTVPFPHCIRCGAITYLNGQEQEPIYSGRSCSGGNEPVTLTLISHREKDSLKFFVQQRTAQSRGGLTLPVVSLKGGGTSSHLANQRLEKGRRTPLFVFAQDSRGVTGINPDDALKDIIAKYQRVIVAFAELGEAEQQ